jgi:YaiO family outer membrane protein
MTQTMPGVSRRRLLSRLNCVLFGTGLAFTASVAAQDSPAGAPVDGYTPVVMPTEKAAIEAMASFGNYDAGYGTAKSYSLRGMQVMDFGVLQAEVIRQTRFGYTGTYGGLNLTHDLSPDYYTMIGLGSGSSLLFPDWRMDLAGYRKFGEQRQYVAGLGAYYAKGNQDGRSDKGLILNGIYYGRDLVLEAGLRGNVANPGSAFGPSQYVAGTFGSDERRAIIVRAERAKETYQVLTSGTEKVDFISHSIGVQWRERMTRDGLLIVGLGYYKNPSYARTAIDVGWRWSFR